jgi:vacuolar-type H+-ATPase subunit D/Vma8
LLTQELVDTRARQRAIENRLVPRLTEALRSLEARLDEFDREENLRLHWAAHRP